MCTTNITRGGGKKSPEISYLVNSQGGVLDVSRNILFSTKKHPNFDGFATIFFFLSLFPNASGGDPPCAHVW